MMYPNKSFFEKVLESAALFALAAWLVRAGVCMIQNVWGWLILFAVLAGAGVVCIRLYRHHKENKF